MNHMMKKYNRCSKCNSTLIYIRIKNPKTRVCRNCGFEELLEKKEEE